METEIEVPAPKRPTVVDRRCLGEGWVVKVRVAKDGTLLNFTDPTGKKVRAVRFVQDAKGDYVALHFHHQKPMQFVGKNISAKAEVWQKTLDNNDQHLYVDLYPVGEDTPATHRLSVMSTPVIPAPRDGIVCFPVPKATSGAIVIAPLPPAQEQRTSNRKWVTARGYTGNPELDKLVSDGWTVIASNEKIGEHWLARDGGKRQMVYPRLTVRA